MPLARGTAVVGYVTLLGLFLAADMEVSASIPEGVQVRFALHIPRHFLYYLWNLTAVFRNLFEDKFL